MCGRFVATKPPQELAEYFEVDEIQNESGQFSPNFNVSPQSTIWAVDEHDHVRTLERLRWGLIPSWAKEASIGNRMINARGETVVEKPAFRRAFKSRRCLIPADGFYEWRRDGAKKIPYFISLKNDEPMAFAGLWELWRDPSQENDAPSIRTCCMITTQANDVVMPIHDRMPVVLPATAWQAWLDPYNNDTESLVGLLRPAPAEITQVRRVSTRVNNARTNEPSLLDPEEK